MIKTFKQTISLALVFILISDPCVSATTGMLGVSAPVILIPKSYPIVRFQEDALALFPLAARRFLFHPFESIESLIHGYATDQAVPATPGTRSWHAQLGPDEENKRVPPVPQLQRKLHGAVRIWLHDNLEKYGHELSYPRRESLKLMSDYLNKNESNTLLQFTNFEELAKWHKFADPEKYKQRLFAAYRADTGQEFILVNSLQDHQLQKMLDDPDGIFACVLGIAHELTELKLEDSDMNPWSMRRDEDEPWAESFILEKIELSLWQLRQAAAQGELMPDSSPEQLVKDAPAPQRKFSQLDFIYGSEFALSHYFDSEWLDAYFKVIKARLMSTEDEPIDPTDIALDTQRWERVFRPDWEDYYQNKWTTIYQQFLSRYYSSNEINRLTPDKITERWIWATKQLRRVSNHNGPRFAPQTPGMRFSPMQANDDDAPLAEAAEEAAKTIYGDRKLPRGERLVDQYHRVADNYLFLCKKFGIKPQKDDWTTALLLGTPDVRLPNKPRELKGLRDKIQRVYNASRIPYDPHEKIKQKKGHVSERRNTLNHMGILGKSVNSLDEWLIVIAKKLTTLEDPRTPDDVKESLYLEFRDIFSPMAPSLGVPEMESWLSEKGLRLAKPKETRDLNRQMRDALGMKRKESKVFNKTLISRISDALDRGHFPLHVFGRKKGIAAAKEKTIIKADKYPQISDIQDLFAYSIILNDRNDLGKVAIALGEEFPDIRGSQISRKLVQIEGYDAYHISFDILAGEKIITFEVQIFFSEEGYHRYKYGRPGAHWARKIKMTTGQRVDDFEEYNVVEGDPRGNFLRYKRALEPWTYFFVSQRQGDEQKLIAERIPQFEGKRGNIADAAALSNLLRQKDIGAYVYRLTRDSDKRGKDQWERLPSNLSKRSLDYVIKDGEVIQFTEGTPTSDTENRAIRSAASFRAIIEINHLFKNNFDKAVERGKSELLQILRTELSPAGSDRPRRMNIQVISDAYKKKVLHPIAVENNFVNTDQLLAVFAFSTDATPIEFTLDPPLIETQQSLLQQIITATQTEGSKLLEANGIHIHMEGTRHQLDQVALSPSINLPDTDGLLIAVGLGLLAPGEIRRYLDEQQKQIKKESAFDQTDAKNFLAIQMNPIAYNVESFVISGTCDHDQPNIQAALGAVLEQHGANLNPGSHSEGLNFYMVIQKDPKINAESLASEIAHLKIPRVPMTPPQKMERFSVSLYLLNQSGAFEKFLTGMKDITDFNVNWYSTDDFATGVHIWMDMELALPEKSDQYLGQTPEQVLTAHLDKMRSAAIIGDYEFSRAAVSYATALEYSAILREEESAQRENWLIKILAAPFRWGSRSLPGNIDPSEVDIFRRAINLAKEIHNGQRRRSRGNPPYVVHLFGVVSKLIGQGVTDPVILIAGLLHDSLERGPEVLFKKNFPGQSVPGPEDPRMVLARKAVEEIIREAFPSMQHRLISILEYMTRYKDVTYAEYARKLSSKGGNDLLALKLADMEDNLVTIFEVERPFAIDQIAKRLRFGLPLVSWETHLKNDVYINSRRDFLNTLAAQSEKLTDEEFYQPYREKGEDRAIADKEVISNIRKYLDWCKRNTDCLPPTPSFEKFQSRLERFAFQLELGLQPSNIFHTAYGERVLFRKQLSGGSMRVGDLSEFRLERLLTGAQTKEWVKGIFSLEPAVALSANQLNRVLIVLKSFRHFKDRIESAKEILQIYFPETGDANVTFALSVFGDLMVYNQNKADFLERLLNLLQELKHGAPPTQEDIRDLLDWTAAVHDIRGQWKTQIDHLGRQWVDYKHLPDEFLRLIIRFRIPHTAFVTAYNVYLPGDGATRAMEQKFYKRYLVELRRDRQKSGIKPAPTIVEDFHSMREDVLVPLVKTDSSHGDLEIRIHPPSKRLIFFSNWNGGVQLPSPQVYKMEMDVNDKSLVITTLQAIVRPKAGSHEPLDDYLRELPQNALQLVELHWPEIVRAFWPENPPDIRYIDIPSTGFTMTRWPKIKSATAIRDYTRIPLSAGYHLVEISPAEAQLPTSGMWVWRKSVESTNQQIQHNAPASRTPESHPIVTTPAGNEKISGLSKLEVAAENRPTLLYSWLNWLFVISGLMNLTLAWNRLKAPEHSLFNKSPLLRHSA